MTSRARRYEVAAAARRLAAVGVPSPQVDAELLAAYVLDVPRGRLALQDAFTRAQGDAYAIAVGRREAREPLQHITGAAPFRRLELAVGPGVFVPRPETEGVVDRGLEALASTPHPPVVVDLCTGSGAIALAIAAERPSAVVYAVELDPAAYRWASRNLADTAVRLVHGDAAACLPELDGSVDLVVANPPYVPACATLPAEVRHDPIPALFAGDDGLDGVRLVANAAARLLRSGGLLVCEHNATHGESAPALLGGLGSWDRVADHPDLTGKPRFVTAYRTLGA